jgi:ankyrin repeat protein
LIRVGAALDLQDTTGKTALMKAIQYNNSLETVQELIRAGAALDLQDTTGKTALDLQDKHDRTALMVSVEQERAPRVGS